MIILCACPSTTQGPLGDRGCVILIHRTHEALNGRPVSTQSLFAAGSSASLHLCVVCFSFQAWGSLTVSPTAFPKDFMESAALTYESHFTDE